MSIKYAEELKKHATQTPQTKPIPGEEKRMVKNSAGGYSYDAGHWTMLDRFLTIGAEGGTYYIGQRDLAVKNAQNVIQCLKEDGIEVIDRTLEISQSGRAATNDPAIFVMALALTPKYANQEVRAYAARSWFKVARTASHLFTFASEVDGLRGWGQLLRNSVAAWYDKKDADRLAYQVIKYRSRRGWTHRDLLRKAHPKGESPEHKALYNYIVSGSITADYQNVPELVRNFERAQAAKTEKELISIITEGKLTHEMIPTQFKKSADVWNALLQDMPMTAMVRNLGVMTSAGLVKGNSNAAKLVVDRLRDSERLQHSRLHPIALLKALHTYDSGGGFLGKLTWDRVGSVSDALQDAFYESFGYVKPTGKTFMLGLDVSSSMSSFWGDGQRLQKTMAGLTPATIAAAMLMVTYRSERYAETIAFASSPRKFNVSRHDSLQTVMSRAASISFGGTDCSAPMTYALKNGINADVFVVYTDSETWAGRIHPMQALRMYRDKTGINAKLVVVGMTSTGFSIADPLDPGTLDVVGFDAGFPNFLSSFVSS